jgi:gliding motility-associated-like protein
MRQLLLLGACLLWVLVGGNDNLRAQPNYFLGNVPTITANPPAPWNAGQVVQFSITVSGFDYQQGNTSAYFHGLGIQPGNCWQNLQYGAPPPTVKDTIIAGGIRATGKWMVVTQNIKPALCSGLQIPGFYFDGTLSANAQREIIPATQDNDPFNNFGEFMASGSWTFTWQAQVPTLTPSDCDLTMKVYIFGDGETGTWYNPPPGCAGGSMPPITGGYVRNDDSQFSTLTGDSVFCSGEEIIFRPDREASSVFRTEWLLDGGVLVTSSPDGSISAFWRTPGIKRVTRRLINQNTNEIFSTYRNIRILSRPNARFSPSSNNLCVGNTAVFIFSGTAEDNATFDWDFGSGAVVNGSGRGPVSVQWTTEGVKNVQLTVRQGNCVPAIHTEQIHVAPKLNFNLVYTDTGCVGDNLLFTDNAPLTQGTIYEWIFEGGEPSHSFGSGAQRVRWRTYGQKTVRITKKFAACDTTVQASVYLYPTPTGDAGGDIPVCYRTLVQLRADIDSSQVADYNTKALAKGDTTIQCKYEWLPNEEFVGRNDILKPYVRPTETRTYTLYAYCGKCVTVIDQVTVLITGSASLGDIEPSPISIALCEGQSVRLYPGISEQVQKQFSIRWKPEEGLDDPTSYTPLASPRRTTNYYYHYTHLETGCSDSTRKTANIIVHNRPWVDLGPDKTVCAENRKDPVLLTPVSPSNGSDLIFDWNPKVDLSCYNCHSPEFLGSVSRAYTLTVIQTHPGPPAVQCTSNPLLSEATIIVRVIPPVQAFTGADLTICEGDTVQIGNPALQGRPDHKYKWQEPGPEQTLSSDTVASPFAFPKVTTTYTLTATAVAGDCESQQKTITITVKKAPTVGFATQSRDICLGDSLTLVPVPHLVPGTPVLEYVWSPKEGLSDPRSPNPKASPRDTTTYTYYLVADGCTSLTKASFTVNIRPYPKIHIMGKGHDKDTVSCLGSIFIPAEVEAPPGTGPFRYRWTPRNLVTGPDSLQTRFRPRETTTFTLTILDQSNGCTYRDTMRVIIPPIFTAEILPRTSPTILCYGDSIELSVDTREIIPINPEQPYRFKWESSTGTGIIRCDTCPSTFVIPDQNMTYILTVMHGECKRIDTKNVIVIPKVQAVFQPAQDTVCVGQSVAFANNSLNAATYLWDFGDGEFSQDARPQHTYLQPGKYAVKLTVAPPFAPQCSDDRKGMADTIVVLPRPEAVFSSFPLPNDTLFLPEQANVRFINQSKGKIFFWDFGDGVGTSTQKDPSYRYRAPGKYTVTLTVTDETGCISTEKLGEFVVAEPSIIGGYIDNVFTPNNDGINDYFGIRYNGREAVQINVFDRWGNIVFQSDGLKSWDGKLPSGNDAAEGTYFYQIKIGEKLFRGELTIVR